MKLVWSPLEPIIQPELYLLMKFNWHISHWLWLYRLECIVMSDFPYHYRMFKLEEIR